jgi:FKBP-type peptidyl-prolyl cis-trans isomerase FklB
LDIAGTISSGVSHRNRFLLHRHPKIGYLHVTLSKEFCMRYALTLCLLLLLNVATAQEIVPLNAKTVKKISDPASYGLGFQTGMQLAQNGLVAEVLTQADILAGMMDALAGKDPAVSEQELQTAMQALGAKLKAMAAAAAKENLVKSNTFIEENKKKPGIQSTATGLQYLVITTGTGATPKLENTVTVHYEGKLISGKVFDSSIKRGEPTTFKVGEVIPGWTEALQRMKVGDKWRVFIPPNLGYGERGAGPAIGPNEALVFEVELLDVK